MTYEEFRQGVMGEPKLIHWVWDDDPDESLCGKDMTGHNWIDPSIPIDCQSCLEIADLIDELEDIGA